MLWACPDFPGQAQSGGFGQFAVFLDQDVDWVTGYRFGGFAQIKMLFQHSGMGVAQFLDFLSRNAFPHQLDFYQEHITVIGFIEHGFQLMLDLFLSHTVMHLANQAFHDSHVLLAVVDNLTHGKILSE